jgi:hypothetical protein
MKENTIAVESEEIKIQRREGRKSVRTPSPLFKKKISSDVTDLYTSLQTSNLIVLGKDVTCKKGNKKIQIGSHLSSIH